ncbi:MAG: glutaredoxin family protein, partial [Sulfuricella sp.]
MKFALFLCCCIAASLAQAAELYRWVDGEGKVHYTDQQPPASAKKVEEKHLGGNSIDTSGLPYKTRQAVMKSPVTLFASDCGMGCDLARELLSQRGIPYTTKNPQTSSDDAQALKKLTGELNVPVLVVGSAVNKGYEKGAWDAALDAAGYPKSALLKKPAPAADVKDKTAAADKP